MTIRLFLLSLIALISTQSFAFEEVHKRAGLGINIPDLGFTSYKVESFTINKISTIKFNLDIAHTRPSDLLVTLTSPSGEYVVLHNMSDELSITVSTDDLLEQFVDKSAAGVWEIQIYDQIKGGSGVLRGIHFVVNGEEIDYSVDRPIVRLTGSSCSSRWSEITSVTSLNPIYKRLVGLCGSELRNEMRKLIATNRKISYDSARKAIFTKIDNDSGKVCSVYSEKCVRTRRIPSNNVMNVEHSWPQSKGAVGTAKSDLHHLFPAMKSENSDRSNYPFCDLRNNSVVGTLDYTSGGSPCYEPPMNHKGDLARAMFYFSVRYDYPIDKLQEAYFRKWNRTDLISSKESRRNKAINNHQGNLNPFIEHPEFVDLISDF